MAVGGADGHARRNRLSIGPGRRGVRRCPSAHAYVSANRRGDRRKVLVHDGIGIWLCARCLHQGGFVRSLLMNEALTQAQFDALVLGLPWQRIGEAGVITVV